MAADGFTFYKIFYFFLFGYATYQCLNACIKGNRDSERESEGQERNDDSGEGVVQTQTSKSRHQTVRGKLEFRKILESTEPGKTAELGPPIEESDIEAGEAVPEVPLSTLALSQLKDMGFSLHASRKALTAVGGSNTEAAMDWIFEHAEDPDVNEDLDTRASQRGEDDDAIIVPYVKQDDSNANSALDNTANSVRSFLTSSMHFIAGLVKNDEECCSICLEAYKVGDTVARLKRTPEQLEREKRCESGNKADHEHDNECNHWFHEDCILEWLQNHDECPLCRTDMVHSH